MDLQSEIKDHLPSGEAEKLQGDYIVMEGYVSNDKKGATNKCTFKGKWFFTVNDEPQSFKCSYTHVEVNPMDWHPSCIDLDLTAISKDELDGGSEKISPVFSNIQNLKKSCTNFSLPGLWKGHFILMQKRKESRVTESFNLMYKTCEHGKISSVRGNGYNRFGSFSICGLFRASDNKLKFAKIYRKVEKKPRIRSKPRKPSISKLERKNRRLQIGLVSGVLTSTTTTSTIAGGTRKRRVSSRKRTQNKFWIREYGNYDNGLKRSSKKAKVIDKSNRSKSKESSFNVTVQKRKSSEIATKKTASSITISSKAKKNSIGQKCSLKKSKITLFRLQKLAAARKKTILARHNAPKKDGQHRTPRVTECDVCLGRTSSWGNELFMCSRCNVVVHRKCYGITDIGVKRWQCEWCKNIEDATPSCCLCPNIGGAVKPTYDGRWAHVLCAYWINEGAFLTPDSMTPICAVSENGYKGPLTNMKKECFESTCMICNIPVGACIKCSYKSCKNSVHAICARSERCYMKMNLKDKSYTATIFCPIHSKFAQEKNDDGEMILRSLDDGENSFYDGELNNQGIPHGLGVCLTIRDESDYVYDGMWKNGKWHGRGTISGKDDSIIYDGDFVHGNFQGWGTYFFKNGDWYSGEWKENMMHGVGTYTDKNGSFYDGQWKQNKRHGKGKLHHWSGYIYVGDFYKNQRHGRGVLTTSDGLCYDGHFKENYIDGRGICKYADGSEYEGGWKNGLKHGRGSIKFANQSAYEGHFRNDSCEKTGRTGIISLPSSIICAVDSSGQYSIAKKKEVTVSQEQPELGKQKENIDDRSDTIYIIPIDFQNDVKIIHLKAGFTSEGK